jgi:dihydrofolate synthase/folylpolyglutamate synthase
MSKAVDYLLSLERFGVKPTLEYVQSILQLLGNPHSDYGIVHVAGSVGKGSVCTYIAEGLKAAGYRVGLNIKPHLQKFNERITVNGLPITDHEMDEMIERIIPLVDRITASKGSPTQFDVSTALAFWYYSRKKVDVVVIETGMGGVWDSTNVVDPILSVITPITYDHTEILGKTLKEIAYQKAGIIKPNKPVVIGPQDSQALEVLQKEAADKGSPVIKVVPAGDVMPANPEDYMFRRGKEGQKRLVLSQTGKVEEEYDVGMLGIHQVENAAIAVSALKTLAKIGYNLDEKAIADSLAKAQLPGRLEEIPTRPNVLLDGAHNEKAAESLAATLKEDFREVPITMVIGISVDKSAENLLRSLLPSADRVIFTQATHSRLGGYKPEELKKIAQKIFNKSIHLASAPCEAVRSAFMLTGPEELICICGSLYLVGEARDIIINEL